MSRVESWPTGGRGGGGGCCVGDQSNRSLPGRFNELTNWPVRWQLARRWIYTAATSCFGWVGILTTSLFVCAPFKKQTRCSSPLRLELWIDKKTRVIRFLFGREYLGIRDWKQEIYKKKLNFNILEWILKHDRVIFWTKWLDLDDLASVNKYLDTYWYASWVL